MTWGELKKAVKDAGGKDEDTVRWIDLFPDGAKIDKMKVRISRDASGGLLVEGYGGQ